MVSTKNCSIQKCECTKFPYEVSVSYLILENAGINHISMCCLLCVGLVSVVCWSRFCSVLVSFL